MNSEALAREWLVRNRAVSLGLVDGYAYVVWPWGPQRYFWSRQGFAQIMAWCRDTVPPRAC